MKYRKLRSIDVPLIRTKTITGVNNWFQALKKADLMWHMDDRADSIVWNNYDIVPPVSSNLLESQRLLAWAICNDHNVDLWEIMPMITSLKEFINTRTFIHGPIVEELAFMPSHDCDTHLMVYGCKDGQLWDLTCLPEKEWPHMEFLRWVPPADGGSTRLDQSIDDPNLMRYTGYWCAQKHNHAFVPGQLHDAEKMLYSKFQRETCF